MKYRKNLAIALMASGSLLLTGPVMGIAAGSPPPAVRARR